MESYLWGHRSRRFLHSRWALFPLADDARPVQAAVSQIVERVQAVGHYAGRVREEAIGEYQPLAVYDFSVFCGECPAGDARQAFSETRFYDQIRLGDPVVQYLIAAEGQ